MPTMYIIVLSLFLDYDHPTTWHPGFIYKRVVIIDMDVHLVDDK